jgi:hypothetical protein
MDALTVFMKTEMAADEIKNRTYKLSQKMRSLLIMIDGKKSVNALTEMARGLGDVAARRCRHEAGIDYISSSDYHRRYLFLKRKRGLSTIQGF